MKRFVVLLLASMLSLPACARPLLIAAASDLSYCIDDIAAAFRKQAPEASVKIATGASGNFFAQIRNGAPFDVFLSADVDYPAQLARLGAADGSTLTRYAVGRLALWSRDPDIDVGKGLALLRDPRIARIAIANPATAPYGRAAKSALERDGLWQAGAAAETGHRRKHRPGVAIRPDRQCTGRPAWSRWRRCARPGWRAPAATRWCRTPAWRRSNRPPS